MYICSASGYPDCGGKIHNLTPHIMSNLNFYMHLMKIVRTIPPTGLTSQYMYNNYCNIK